MAQSPSFWWTKTGWQPRTLWPLACLYGLVAGRTMRRPNRASVAIPVICIGNFTVGGAGKTPTALAIARAARAKGLKPGFLSRGYGGSLRQATIVDPSRHRANQVGDEALLLAAEGLTAVSRNRIDGAERLRQAGADVIIMDDGFQSARVHLDFALLVVDARRGLGNGHLVPAGPVRAPLAEQMQQMSAILKVGEGDAAGELVRQAARAGKPVHVATLRPLSDQGLAGARVLAFTGIADPEKFYRTVDAVGGTIAERRSFADHHLFTEAEIEALLAEAQSKDLLLVTTAKDAVRLRGRSGPAETLLNRVKVVEVAMAFDDPHAPDHIIDAAFEHFRHRRFAIGGKRS